MPSSLQKNEVTDGLCAQIGAELSDLVALRRDLHAHPELMFNESRTSAVVRQRLDALGIEHASDMGGREASTGTGVIGFLPATVDDPGACVGLRADMDALPIVEATGKDYASTAPGVMHACGHDGHTAILVGAAAVLSKLEHRPNPVRFVFQPAEEGGAGAEKMIRDGALAQHAEHPKVERMYGLHGWPSDELAVVSTRPGPLLAATDTFTVRISGQQGHAAYPHLCVDPIVAASQIVTALQTICSRSAMPTDAVVISVGSIHAGSAYNVIPQTVEMKGTVRTLRHETRAMAEARFRRIVESTSEAMGCTSEILWNRGYPVTHNDASEAQRVLRIGEQADFARRSEIREDPTLGGEDFSYYSELVPSCFFFLGLSAPDQEERAGLHTDLFDFNDDAIGAGVEMMCRLALS
jgi:amidohydrolase